MCINMCFICTNGKGPQCVVCRQHRDSLSLEATGTQCGQAGIHWHDLRLAWCAAVLPDLRAACNHWRWPVRVEDPGAGGAGAQAASRTGRATAKVFSGLRANFTKFSFQKYQQLPAFTCLGQRHTLTPCKTDDNSERQLVHTLAHAVVFRLSVYLFVVSRTLGAEYISESPFFKNCQKLRILWQDTSWYTLNHMFFSWIHIWIHGEFMIFHEFIYAFMIFHVFIHEFCARTLFGTPEFINFQEFMPDIMDFGLFSWERSYHKSCLIHDNIVKNIVKNIVQWWKVCMNSSLNLLEFMARCANTSYLTGPGHSAAAAPEPPASLSAYQFQ